MKIVFGILSTVLAILSWFVFWWLGIVSIIFGILGLAIKQDGEITTKTSVKVLCVIGIVVASIGLLIILSTIRTI